jgi:hypothetical protein
VTETDGPQLPRYRRDMPDSARDRAAAGDRAAQLNEQVAQGHEWAAHAKPDSSGDLHSDAATSTGGPPATIAATRKPPVRKPTQSTIEWRRPGRPRGEQGRPDPASDRSAPGEFLYESHPVVLGELIAVVARRC